VKAGGTILWQTRWRGQAHNFVVGAGEELIPLEIWLQERGQTRAESAFVVRAQSQQISRDFARHFARVFPWKLSSTLLPLLLPAYQHLAKSLQIKKLQSERFRLPLW
jgi:hypothetical protein